MAAAGRALAARSVFDVVERQIGLGQFQLE
jgi:hypothetical protein